MLIAGLLGQVDLAADNLKLVIFGLLMVAALLALLTVWYWLRTKPSPVVITSSASSALAGTASGSTAAGSASSAQPSVASDDDVFERAMGDDFDPDSVWADSTASTAPAVQHEVIVPAVPSVFDRLDDDEEMSAEEWLSITGPDQRAD